MAEKKITVVTPVYNQVDYIEETILSVLNQGYSNLEYIIIDGGSTDGTLEIIKKYESQITKWISEPDRGMYDALNKGFERSTGEIMCYINSDDLLLPNSLENIAKVFGDLENVEWIHGLNSFINAEGRLVDTRPAKRFSFLRYLDGDYKFIQQESCVWRRSLWEKAGSRVDSNINYAGDFELWFRFFQHAQLYHCSIPIGGWRKRKGQLSELYLDKYFDEINTLIYDYKPSSKQSRHLAKIKKLKKLIKFLKFFKIFNTRHFEIKIYELYQLKNTDLYYAYKYDKFKITNLITFTYY